MQNFATICPDQPKSQSTIDAKEKSPTIVLKNMESTSGIRIRDIATVGDLPAGASAGDQAVVQSNNKLFEEFQQCP